MLVKVDKALKMKIISQCLNSRYPTHANQKAWHTHLAKPYPLNHCQGQDTEPIEVEVSIQKTGEVATIILEIDIRE